MKPAPVGVARPVSHHITNEAFHQAVAAARHAPSAYDLQPWQWRITDVTLDLFVDHTRLTTRTDPDARLATISCGAALHHARLTLAAHGWRATVTRSPDDADPAHLARVRIDGPAPVDAETAELARVIDLRHTDIHPVTGDPVEPATLRTIATAFEAQHVRLGLLRPDQILELAVAAADSASLEPAVAQWQKELALWAGNDRIVGSPGGRLPTVSCGRDRAATFALLHGPRDNAIDWLHAGEALSAGSLVASTFGVSVLPFSAPIEFAVAREALARVVPELGFPYLMVSLGRHPAR
ncbi:nitroreductase [Actinoplanes sp. NBC_00393]|uniref:nitroreductase n=1 Tax=Actinoplanes sp. NBC_00393 TaxID=2975953 RepID=UPI002E233A94